LGQSLDSEVLKRLNKGMMGIQGKDICTGLHRGVKKGAWLYKKYIRTSLI